MGREAALVGGEIGSSGAGELGFGNGRNAVCRDLNGDMVSLNAAGRSDERGNEFGAEQVDIDVEVGLTAAFDGEFAGATAGVVEEIDGHAPDGNACACAVPGVREPVTGVVRVEREVETVESILGERAVERVADVLEMRGGIE